jgi:diacylglycerol kinase (ATP)
MIFANPIAGRGKGARIANDIQQSLKDAGFLPRVQFRRPSDLSSEDLKTLGGIRAIVCIGGDGTLRAVVQCVMKELIDREPPPIVLVPMGTANLMGQYLGIHWNDESVGEEVVGVIRRGTVSRIDLSRGSGQGSSDELMLLVAGVGIDGKVVHELNRVRQGPISYLSYALPAALAVGLYRYPSLTVRVDGKQIWQGAGITLIGNVKEYGTGFPVLPHALPNDGLLDVCCMPCHHPGELVKLFLQTAAGEHLESEGVVYVKGKAVEIQSNEERAPVQVDGEAAGFTPVKFEILPVKVPFLTPAALENDKR